MKISAFFFKLLILFLFAGCALGGKFTDFQKEKMLREQLLKWEHFRLDGIIEMNYKSFSFRKNITVRKNSAAIRFDIYDSGILGLHPTPFISAYVDSVVIIKMSGKSEITRLNFDEKDNQFLFLNYLNPDLILVHKSEIFRTGKVTIGEVTCFFSEKMELEKISSADVSVNFVYDNFRNPLTISLYFKNEKIAEIQVDKINYEIPEIEAIKSKEQR
ncbi:MAG: hypothetical protein DRZ79_00495 [Candidatus Cloacimonadota bacterium]|nr:MAG: hypothetical protein DRZ79_00495 [Candidatus Cloacimonadota bacterium]